MNLQLVFLHLWRDEDSTPLECWLVLTQSNLCLVESPMHISLDLLTDENGPKISVDIPSVTEATSVQTGEIPSFPSYPFACKSPSVGFAPLDTSSAASLTWLLLFSVWTSVKSSLLGWWFLTKPILNGDRERPPADLNHSAYWYTTSPHSYSGQTQCFRSCPKSPQKWQNKGKRLYLNKTHELFPSNPPIKPARRRGFNVRTATLTHEKILCIQFLPPSTSTTSPRRPPISAATLGDDISNGAPQIWTQRATESNLTLAAVIPGCHLLSRSTWLSKD